MTTVALTSSPATLDPGTAYELFIVNSGSAIAHVQINGGRLFDERLNVGQSIRVPTGGNAVTAYVRSGSGQVDVTATSANPQGAPSHESGQLDAATARGTYVPLRNSAGTPYYDVIAFAASPTTHVPGASASADTAAALACLTQIAADATAGRATRVMRFAPGIWKINPNVLQVGFRGLVVEGHAGARPGSMGGTSLALTGAGWMWQMGTDDGRAYDDATDYSGTADYYTFRDLMFDTAAQDTVLENGSDNSYLAGTTAVKDWRGGDALFDNCRFEHFDFYFWGVQSDQNIWRTCRFLYNHSGGYFGPLSDQQTFYDPETWRNDRLFTFDAASKARFFGGNLVGNGSTTTNPYKITSTSALYGANDISFHGTWFEHHQGAATVEALIEVGVGATTTCAGLRIYAPHVVTESSGAGNHHAQNFLRLEKADRVFIDSITSGVLLDNIIKFTGSTSPRVIVTASQDVSNAFLSTNAGTGTPEVDRWSWGNGHYFSTGRDVVTGTFQAASGQNSDILKLKDANGDKFRFDINGHMGAQRNVFVNTVDFSGTTTGGGFGVMPIQNRVTAPSANPSGGAVHFAEGGVPRWRTASGSLLTVGDVLSKTATYAMASNDSVILASGTFTVTLLSDARGRQATVKNTGTGTITVAGSSGNVEGATTTALAPGYSHTYCFDGTDWWIV